MGKRIDLSKTVSQLVKEYPEVKGIMVGLGFKDITSPAALMFMGKVMTIPKGSAIKGVPMGRIVAAFEEAGFEVVGADLPAREAEGATDEPAAGEARDGDKNAQLRALIERLNAGEGLESVRADFVRQFESVAVDDIVAVEQALLDEGMPLVEVQRACDLHSALFHGHNEGEACAMGEGADVPTGHPVDVLRRENRALEAALVASDADALAAELSRLRGIGTLYSKKESILMPMLLRHGVTGPSDVMWGVDDEIKAEVARLHDALAADSDALPPLRDDVAAVLARMREMVYKEENILFPLCLQSLTDDEWLEAYRDLPEMGNVFAGEPPRWQHAELELAVRASLAARQDEPDDGVIRLPGGERDSMEVWTPNPDHPVRVLYMAVRDEDGAYLGAVELVEDFTAVRERFLGER